MPDIQEQSKPTPALAPRPDGARSAWSAEPPPAKSRGRFWLVLLLLLGAGGAGGWWWWSSRTPAAPTEGGPQAAGKKFDPSARKVPVQVAKVRAQNLDIHLAGLGTVTPRNVVVVKSRVDGQLMKVKFREGQLVEEGDLLATIDPRPFEVQLAQMNGQMLRDEALLKNAELDLQRYRKLLAEDSIAAQQVDTQESLVRQYRGTVAADRGQVDNARLQLSYCRITAPIDGRVGLRAVDPGNIVHASDTTGIVTITQVSPTTVIFTLPEDELPKVVTQLNASRTLAVEAWDRAGKQKLATGTLLTIDNQIDTTTGTAKLKAEFANEDGMLFPNQFVNVKLLVDTRKDAIVIPTAAIQRGIQGNFAYLLKDDNTVTVRPLKTGPNEGELTVVESGVVPGDSVVSDGADKLREGARVDPTQRGAGLAVPADGAKGRRGDKAKWGQGGAGGAADAAGPAGAAGSGKAGAGDAAAASGGETGAGTRGEGGAAQPGGGWKHRKSDAGGTAPDAAAAKADGSADAPAAAPGGAPSGGQWKRRQGDAAGSAPDAAGQAAGAAEAAPAGAAPDAAARKRWREKKAAGE